MNYNLLKEKRIEKNLSQNEIADMLGISRQAYSKWENGKAIPATNNLIMICEILDVPIERIMEDPKPVYKYSRSKTKRRKRFKIMIFRTIGCLIIFPSLTFLLFYIVISITPKIQYVRKTNDIYNQTVGYMNYVNYSYDDFCEFYDVKGICFIDRDLCYITLYDKKGHHQFIDYSKDKWFDYEVSSGAVSYFSYEDYMMFFTVNYEPEGEPLGINQIAYAKSNGSEKK